MNIGQNAITVGSSPELGPPRIQIFQPTASTVIVDFTAVLQDLQTMQQHLQALHTKLDFIIEHLTRPPWYVRLWRKLCGTH